MIQVSIDMSKDDETYQNRIFGEVIDIQDNILICEYIGVNYDFDNVKTINKQQAEINRLREALKSVKQQTINLGDYEELGAIATISDICNKALSGES